MGIARQQALCQVNLNYFIMGIARQQALCQINLNYFIMGIARQLEGQQSKLFHHW